MTFSIIAKCRRTGQFGVGAVTGVAAVGKFLANAAAGAGAVATQGRVNPYLGLDGLQRLKSGFSAGDTLTSVLSVDTRAGTRQCAVIDVQGRTAVWTGPETSPWAGAEQHDHFSVQGNLLAGAHVLRAIADTFKAMEDAPLEERLLVALTAGEAAGGDRRGERSAAIFVVDREEYPLWDIRVDHHHDPLSELKRLHEVFARELIPEIRKMPTRARPGGFAD